MAGLYIHIPFCKKACHYCNFHFSTRLLSQQEMVDAICTEIGLRKDYLGKDTALASIYFGGGTPSLLTIAQFQKIFAVIGNCFTILPGAEITIETNPDDINPGFLQDLKSHTPVNRLSIGIQSFNGEALLWMNRAHTASQAIQAIEMARMTGFDNITADLIYGLPAPFNLSLQRDLQQLIALQIPHLSCYALTVEAKTVMAYQVRKQLTTPLSDQQANEQYQYISDTVRTAGYTHYEISNMAKPGYEAIHNSNYWEGEPYLGIGPSAHSYKPHERSWNVSNNSAYIRAIREGLLPAEKEFLTIQDRYNEYIMTGLRLEKGISLLSVAALFGEKYREYLLQQLIHIPAERYTLEKDKLCLTDAGRLWCDNISATLFLTA